MNWRGSFHSSTLPLTVKITLSVMAMVRSVVIFVDGDEDEEALRCDKLLKLH